jgi:acyl carrier protein
MSIEEKVKSIISDELSIPSGDIELDHDLIDDLGIDSLGTVELALALEDVFDCLINDEELEKFRTVDDVINWLEKNTGEK